ncbi:hypothetical protein C8R43DRAFT_1125714 [Mycena crocata]|nr:hypothetical protein C8R43DRAFT_1125714 [Mycena crocata]
MFPSLSPSPEAFGFKRPPLDGSLLIPEIIANHATDNATYPLFRYLDTDGTVKTIPWSEAVVAFHRAAQLVREQVAVDSPAERPVVAILASIDQISYFSLVAGIMSAGYQVFPLSPRNSKLGILHLLQSTKCSHLLVSADAAIQALALDVAATIVAEGGRLKLIPTPSFEDLYLATTLVQYVPPSPRPKSTDITLILHSSGSVSLPKPIPISYESHMQNGINPYYGEVDFCGHVWAAHAMPTFHAAGNVQLFWAVLGGITLSVLPPVLPPVVPTPARVFEDAIATGCTIMYSVPSFLETWARVPENLPILKAFRSVCFAGGPLQHPIGDLLSKNGVNLAHMYGLTEAGGINMIIPTQAPKEDWSYFQLSAQIDPVLVKDEDIPGVYRLVLKKCATHTPSVYNAVVDGVPAFDTKDLLIRHPDNEKLWRLYGRNDDQINHSNGEKTNPGPLEAIILKDPRIKHAVMFGQGQFNAGVLLFPAEPFDPSDTERLIAFRRDIWPTVQEANQFAPTHSRIFKEASVVADPSKPIELTAKGTARRAAALAMYETEIQEVYIAMERSSQTHLVAPTNYDIASSLEFVSSAVREVMVKLPGDEEDLFQNGCDRQGASVIIRPELTHTFASLQATWIRNSILHALRTSTKVKVETIPGDFVYSYPTVRLLAQFLTEVASGSASAGPDLDRHASAMEEMVRKYSQHFPAHVSTTGTPKTEGVLVTGTTGALGSYILANLLSAPEVSVVYAINRPGGDIQNRQRTSFVTNGVDVGLLTSPKLKLREGNLSTAGFGLASEDYKEMQESVTCIIHNAWQVDFKMSVHSMEPCVKDTRNLVDFALKSPHTTPCQFIFIGTAGVFRNCNEALEERIPDAKTAAGSGYAESKWVAEQMLEAAAAEAGLSPVIIRPGQLSGGIGGAWKTNDWFPIMVRSSQLLGHLPNISGHISWVPLHHAGKIVVEMRTSQKRYLHLTHPQPIPFSDVLLAIGKTLKLPVVPYAQWLQLLNTAASQGSDNPGVRLLEFFRANKEVSSESEAFFPAPMANANAAQAAQSLSSLGKLDTRDANEWVDYFRKVGYLD